MTMISSTLILLLATTLLNSKSSFGLNYISHDGACSVTTDQGHIDLNPLYDPTIIPRFQDIPVPNQQIGPDFSYSWNPCKDYTDTHPTRNECDNVAICQVVKYTPYTYYQSFGATSSAAFFMLNGKLVLQYTASEGSTGLSYQANITLTCNKEATTDTLTIPVQANPSSYSVLMNLESKHCCPKPSSPNGSGLSGGSVLCIILLVLVIAYAVIGVLIMSFYKGAQGLDKIPNRTFWTGLPSLVKDGACFICCICRRGGESGTANQYDSM